MKKNISPTPQQPIERKPSGKLPEALAELNEATLSDQTHAAGICVCAPPPCICSFDGDDE